MTVAGRYNTYIMQQDSQDLCVQNPNPRTQECTRNFQVVKLELFLTMQHEDYGATYKDLLVLMERSTTHTTTLIAKAAAAVAEKAWNEVCDVWAGTHVREDDAIMLYHSGAATDLHLVAFKEILGVELQPLTPHQHAYLIVLPFSASEP